MCSSLSHTNRCSASVRCLIYARWNAWKAQAQDWREADLAYIRPEATLVPVLCGMKKCGVVELRNCGVGKVEIGPFLDFKLDVYFLM